ncbi:MAG: hypothetical protein Q9170_006745, partial [Blastenia crenularia]
MPKDMAYYGQQEDLASDDSSTIRTAPSSSIYAPEIPETSADQRPAPTSRTAENPKPSDTMAQSATRGQSNQGTGMYPRPRPSYPLYYNSSSIPGSTAAYGTAASSGFPWKNYTVLQQSIGSIGSPSTAESCPPPSTVTIQNTVTAPPIAPPPITITITSTLTSSFEALPPVTPTVTITITATVCVGNGQNTGTGGSAPSVAVSSGGPGGGQGLGADFTTGSAGLESSLPVASEPVSQTSAVASNIGVSEPFPQSTGAGGTTQPYQPPFSNGTRVSEASVPVGTGGFLSTSIPANSFAATVQTQSSSSLGSLEQNQPPASGAATTNIAATSMPALFPTSNAPAITSGQDTTQTSVDLEQPQTSIQYPAETTSLSTGGQEPINTQFIPNTSSEQVPNPVVSSPNGVGSISQGISVTPPYGFHNTTTIASGTPTGSNSYGTGPGLTYPVLSGTANIIASVIPPFVNTTSPFAPIFPAGTGIPKPPGPTTAPAPQSSVFPSLVPLSPAPFQTPPFPIIPDNITSSDFPLTSQMPLSTGPAYMTLTKEVSPVPLVTSGNTSTPQKSYGKFYGSGAPTSNPAVAPNTGSGSLGAATTWDKDK